MWVIRLTIAGILLVANITQAQWRQPVTDVIEAVPAGQINWTTGVASGQARTEVVEPTGAFAARRASAFTTTVQRAQQRLLTTLMQLPLDTERTIGDIVRDSGVKRQAIAELVAAAEVVQTRYLPRGVVETTLQLPVFGELTSLVWPTLVTGSGPAQGEAAETAYTGVIIDARGLAIRPALFPRIVDEDARTLYAPTHVNPDMAMQRGYVVYTKTLERAQAISRIGKHPLVVRALRVTGQTRIDLLIGRAEAMKLRRSMAIRSLLKQCQIVIVG